MFVIYKITDPYGRSYIGITKRGTHARWLSHVNDARNGSGFALHAAIRKYGADRFTIEVLTTCVDRREATVCERALISAHGTFVRSGNGYNLTLGGDGNWGWSPAESALEKMRAKARARMARDPGHITRMIAARGQASLTGRRFSDEHRKNISISLKLSFAKRGGFTEEHRKKISAGGMGRLVSDETRKKRSATLQAMGYRPTRLALAKAILARNPGEQARARWEEVVRAETGV